MIHCKFHLKRTVQSQAEASANLTSPGDAVVVERGQPRWLLLKCPCGCGDNIPINLDARSGKAWRLYRGPRSQVSLYPSVWRDTGCESHFIIWRNEILLLGHTEESWESLAEAKDRDVLVNSVRNRLGHTTMTNYVAIADALGAIPWDVLDACRHLVSRGLAVEGHGSAQGSFRLT